MENITPKFSLTCLKCEVASLSLSCLLSLASGEAPVGMVALSCLQGLGKSSGPEFLLPQNLKNSEFLPHSCSQHPSDQRWAQFPVLPLSPPPSLPPFLPITPLSSHPLSPPVSPFSSHLPLPSTLSSSIPTSSWLLTLLLSPTLFFGHFWMVVLPGQEGTSCYCVIDGERYPSSRAVCQVRF